VNLVTILPLSILAVNIVVVAQRRGDCDVLVYHNVIVCITVLRRFEQSRFVANSRFSIRF